MAKARRNESNLASAALVLVLALVVFFGCRAFDPEPVLVNVPPDTFITGAPAETTGTVFRRHVYWYGSDSDGEVVRFIYAITDSTVRDPTNSDEDEEDARFDPADDITTLEPIDGRVVGYTDETDSVFVFQIDRESNTSKDITFHLVAVDDRGTMDPEPARLHFFNNSLGNPVIRFTVSTLDDAGAETVRWIGGVDKGPKLPGVTLWPWDPDPTTISPEATGRPFVGFKNRFRICWEASSPNGAVIGFKYKASELANSRYRPTNQFGEEIWTDARNAQPGDNCFEYQNDVAHEDLGEVDCPSGWIDCPEQRRWNSGAHRLQIIALDQALVQSPVLAGELSYTVNYPPLTWLVNDHEVAPSCGDIEKYPHYREGDPANPSLICTFSEGDTVPDGSYVTFKMFALDRLVANQANPLWPAETPCCDEIFDPDADEVKYQVQIADARALNDQGAQNFWSTFFSVPDSRDTLGFNVGPFAYRVLLRGQDEHGLPDPEPISFTFVGGFNPRIVSLSPADGDTLMLRNPNDDLVHGHWPQNTISYGARQNVTRYWDGLVYHDTQDDPGWSPVQGTAFRYQVEFLGEADARETAGAVRSWAYGLFSERDPNNFFADGAGTDNITIYDESPVPNRWLMDTIGQGPEVFVPNLLWTFPNLFDPANPASGPPFNQVGPYLRRRIGAMTLQVVGKSTIPGQEHTYYPFDVRPGGSRSQTRDLTKLGRRTEQVETKFAIYLGLAAPGSPTTFQGRWPIDFVE